ncbi:uncharacterized protein LOC121108767 isoform X2 [Gallus gallus]|uniref:uncharacterized protein LOC121108767 isoform X2 n=1 Tax=Gallus gallus TaxID=9031 RepID=UPI001F023BE8|nr:uncharacterized protein LOC121108767 isoform X2 [Gallus gallus]
MVSGSSVPPPVASPRMRAAPRRKRGRTGAVLRTAAPEAGAGQRYCSSSGSFAAQLGSRRCGCERRSTALRAAAKLLPDCCGVTSLSSSLTGPPSPSQDPHSPLMRNPAAIHISGWGLQLCPNAFIKDRRMNERNRGAFPPDIAHRLRVGCATRAAFCPRAVSAGMCAYGGVQRWC